VNILFFSIAIAERVVGFFGLSGTASSVLSGFAFLGRAVFWGDLLLVCSSEVGFGLVFLLGFSAVSPGKESRLSGALF